MHVHGGVAENGAKITTWNLVQQANLRWIIHSTNGGFYITTSVNQDFALHQHGGNNDNGGECTLWNRKTHPNSTNIIVNFERTNDGYWLIKFLHSSKCAHVHGGGTANGTPITQWDSVDAPNLKWQFVPVEGGNNINTNIVPVIHGSSLTEFVDNGREIYIQSALAPIYMHVHGGVAENGAKITTWNLVQQANLRWTICSTNGGFYITTSVNQDFALHQHGGNNDNGGECTLWNRKTHPNSTNIIVNFERTNDGYWLIKFLHSSKCAHVHGGGTANGTPITQWDSVDAPNLKWLFIPV